MSRYHQKKSRHRYDVIDDRPMLSSEEADTLEAATNDDFDYYDPKYDEDVNRFLDEASEELFKEKEIARTPMTKVETPEETHDTKPNYWYQDMCKIKIRETKERMEDLSKLACYTCVSIGAHIKRMEQDHGTTFCKMDYCVRHPPLNRPWTNIWKFNCTIKCRETGEPSHTHTAYCESVVLEHVDPNISEIDYPEYVKDAVQLFEDFAYQTNRNGPMTDTKESSDTAYLKTMWTGIKVLLRSNCHNELMMIVRSKETTSLLHKLKRFFKNTPEADTNVVSVFCIDKKWFPARGRIEAGNVTGLYKLVDKVGPISIEYKPKTNADFNAVEATQLAKIIKEYAGLTQETTLLDIGCNFGVLSLMMSLECEAVFGINTMHSNNNEIPQAEELKKLNGIHNTSFIPCNPDELLTKCSPYIKQCITVAVLNLASNYGKSKNVMQALRNLPSIWKVVVYGTFTKEFHRNINTLITEDHTLGERYLPMQGCILDKSPSAENAFDIVILFERQSLITPKVELLAPGPTLNIKVDSEAYEYGLLDVKDMKPKREDRYQESKSSRAESEEKLPSRSTDARRSDYSRVEERPVHSSSARREKDRSSHSSRSREHRTEHSRRSRDDQASPVPREERPHSDSRHRSSSTSFKDRQMLRDERFDSPPPRNHEKLSHQSRDRQPRVPPTSPLPIPKDKSPPSTSRSRSSSTSTRDKSPLEKSPQEPRDKQPPASYPLLSVKKEFQFSCPSLPTERVPSPPLFPSFEETDFLEEDFVVYPPSRTVKAEPTQLCESREKVVPNAADDGVFKVPGKPEPTNPTYSESPQSPALANLQHEPEDMEISPSPPDFQSMETPIHNPRDLAHPPPPPPSTNVTLGEFEFPLQANLSYLTEAKYDKENDLSDVSQIKKEKDAGDEILATGEMEVDDTPEIKKEKDAGDETLATDDETSEIKMEKDAGDETLITGETADETPETKREKVTGEETLTTGETADETLETKREKVTDEETFTTGETAGQTRETKKEKDTVEETLTTREMADDAPGIKREKVTGDETLTTETADKTPEIKKEKDAGDETLATSETADETPEIKKEKDAGNSTLTTGETADEENARVKIKTEVVDPGYSASSSEVNCEKMPSPVTIKSEPVESPEIPPVSVKNEPVDMEISSNPHNIKSVETPMHNPRVLDESSPTSPPANDLEFSVQPNLSYLPIKREPEQPTASVNVKTEPDDEIAIIGEKRSKPKKSQPKIRVKTVDEIIKVKTELKEQEDLRTLYEQRQAILRKLGREEEERPATDLPRAYKRPPSRSPSRKYKRSPGSSPKRRSRSPSPYYKRKRSRKSPSERRRRRSPSSPIRFKKEPLSPTSDRRRDRNRRSPSFDIREVYGTTKARDRRSRRSRSRSPRRR